MLNSSTTLVVENKEPLQSTCEVVCQSKCPKVAQPPDSNQHKKSITDLFDEMLASVSNSGNFTTTLK